MSGKLIVVSNRIPTAATPAGGLVYALHETLRKTGGIWVGSDPEFHASPSRSLTEIGDQSAYRRLAFGLTELDHQTFYLGFANSVLWPVCHRRGDLVRMSRRFEQGYRRVNKRLAQQIFEVAKVDDTIWVHDYHFFPLASELRKLGFEGKIGFFLHIPFPALGDLGALPLEASLARWLADYDLVGLQTRADVARCLEMFRSELGAELMNDGKIKYGDQTVGVRSFPIGIDVDTFVATAKRPMADAKLAADLSGDIVIGVDRLDYSKGLPNRFRAFGRYLETRTDKSRRASLLQIAPPTREEVTAYQDIRHELEELAGRLNGENAELDWTPLRYIHRNIDRNLLAKLYRIARVGLVTPFADGMNLVAKEYIAAQDPNDPGVLVLSRMAGAAEDMTQALLVNPYDIEEMSEALTQALNMPLQERQDRYEACMAQVKATDVGRWSENYLSALKDSRRKLSWDSFSSTG
ncbi:MULTISPECIES: alpha,alpha-trehalose-phosphate synthase (UDP-forming) [Roseobacteraceae]|jgi:trehalose 6-phosphate synthase|uniref:Alpha,alpha-trehalose-phosphate synthase (UDP-forming) n=1 Tax=Pseudosulfitobacter pseudonitzschiae TaxID=1402135 RepID=A0A221JX59_9RHOB|nr:MULTISPECIES: trehalose-6-phosphate synthase [Roseobacteraceae]ASM71318.1 alpha,alpha-trehalose-phosphate synthase (UDP-forming) [Pseudosulfitobacter pseudonitzschiae]